MNTDYRFEFILNNNDGAFIYYENLLTGKLERTNYDRRIMDWLLNTNIEHGRETRLCPHCLYLREIIRTKTAIDKTKVNDLKTSMKEFVKVKNYI